MSKFVFEKKDVVVEAYGRQFTLPAKTPALMEQLTAANMADDKSVDNQVRVVLLGLEAVIGKAAVDEIFPNYDAIDTDELSAFWLFITNEYQKQAQSLLGKYAPERVGR